MPPASFRRARPSPWRKWLFPTLTCVGLLLAFAGMNGSQGQNDWLHLPEHYWTPLPAAPDLQDPLRLVALPEVEEDGALRRVVEDVLAKAPANLTPHLYYLDLETGRYLNLGGDTPVPAASVVKLPILLEYFRALSEGKITPTAPLAYDPIHQAAGSGDLQFKSPGVQLQSLDVATMMIQSSDNSATDILIDHLGGMTELNQRFRRMGLTETRLQNWLPDLDGTNTISPRDMAAVLYNIAKTDYLTQALRTEALRILEGTHNRRLIPAGLPENTVVAHKTGDIGTSLGNAALVTLPSGKQYLLAIQVERPYNDGNAKPLIISLSQAIYQHQQAVRVAASPGKINVPSG